MSCTEEGQFLEGEERIAFLMSKIQDLRRVYMDLKAEVACIDRRRRRHRIKEREGMQRVASSLFSVLALWRKWVDLPKRLNHK